MSFQDYQGILGIIGGMIGLAVAVATYFRGVIQQNQKIHEMEVKQLTMQTRFDVFWAVIEKELPKILIKPHREPIDAYMRKMRDEGLCNFTEEELEDFRDRMMAVVDKRVEDSSQDDDSLRIGYVFVLGPVTAQLAITKHIRRSHGGNSNKDKDSSSSDHNHKGGLGFGRNNL